MALSPAKEGEDIGQLEMNQHQIHSLPPTHAPPPPPVVRLAQLREELRSDGTLETIAEGLREIDLRKGKSKDPISDFVRHCNSTPTMDYVAKVLQLHNEVLERQAEVRDLSRKKSELECRLDLLKKAQTDRCPANAGSYAGSYDLDPVSENHAEELASTLQTRRRTSKTRKRK